MASQCEVGKERWKPNPLPSFSVIRVVLSGVTCSPDIPGSELETVVQMTYPALRAAPLSIADSSDSPCIHHTLSHDNSKPRLLWQPGAGDLSSVTGEVEGPWESSQGQRSRG